MWPLDLLRKRKYERNLKAALLVLLGAHLLEKLPTDQQRRVEEALAQNMKRSSDPPAAWHRWYQWSTIAAFRAGAMDKAGVPLPLPDYSWADLFKPWQRWAWFNPVPPFLKGFDVRPLFVLLDYRPMSQAAIDARRLLRSYGMIIPDHDPPR
jgi:hypothetical protein